MSRQRSPAARQAKRRPVLECLSQEHRHIAALLALLEQRLGNTRNFSPGDLCLLADVIGYLHDFPDQVHHPTENLLFDQLLQRRPDLEPELAGLRQEHEQLAAETQDLLDALEQAINTGGATAQPMLRTRIRDFVSDQRAHMEREGRSIFTAAKTGLLEKDWRVLEQRTQLHEDPLFGAGVQPRQRLLFEFLAHPQRPAATAMLASGLDMQERLVDMVAVVESGAAEAVGIFASAARVMAGEARDLLLGESHYADPWQRLAWPWHCGRLLGQTAWRSSGALLEVSGKTAKELCVAALRRQQADSPS